MTNTIKWEQHATKLLIAMHVVAIGALYVEDNLRHQWVRPSVGVVAEVVDANADRKIRLFNAVTSKYVVDEQFAAQVIDYAFEHERDVFPRAEHIVAVIGIESSWRPHVKSRLKSDPAVGLTQIRPGVWKHLISDPKELKDVNNQVKYSAIILDEYYTKLGDVSKTIIAYNAGLTAFIQKRYNRNYITKFNNEMDYLTTAAVSDINS